MKFKKITNFEKDDILLDIKEEKELEKLAKACKVFNKSINQGTQNPRQPKFLELEDLDRATRDYGFITAIHYYTKDDTTILADLEKIAMF